VAVRARNAGAAPVDARRGAVVSRDFRRDNRVTEAVMAVAQEEITCPVCGFRNALDAGRCQSCGAKVEAYTAAYTSEEEYARRHQQDDFRWTWAAVAALLYVVLQGIVLAALPRAIPAFDPQGMAGLMVSIGVAFVGGILVAWISPGKTFIEVPVGAMIATIPTLAYIALTTPDGFQPTMLAYIICAMMGVMISLIGAFLGERVEALVTRRG
jgi:hypothetical protein